MPRSPPARSRQPRRVSSTSHPIRSRTSRNRMSGWRLLRERPGDRGGSECIAGRGGVRLDLEGSSPADRRGHTELAGPFRFDPQAEEARRFESQIHVGPRDQRAFDCDQSLPPRPACGEKQSGGELAALGAGQPASPPFQPSSLDPHRQAARGGQRACRTAKLFDGRDQRTHRTLAHPLRAIDEDRPSRQSRESREKPRRDASRAGIERYARGREAFQPAETFDHDRIGRSRQGSGRLPFQRNTELPKAADEQFDVRRRQVAADY